LLACGSGVAWAQNATPDAAVPSRPAPAPAEQGSAEQTVPDHVSEPMGTHTHTDSRESGELEDEWLDRTQKKVHDMVSHSAMGIDRLFGSQREEADYGVASGSISPALLWDEFHGFQPKLRFRVDLPLPSLDERFNAFIGRVDRGEFVSESTRPSGAFQRQYGPATEEQTLAGIVYRTPSKQGSRFDAGAGVRVQLPLDPYLKGAYVFERGTSETGLMSFRETVFWQNSQHAGFTSRVDLERILAERWLLRWTTSATISERSEGVFGYSAVTGMLGLPGRRAVAVEVGFDGEADAPVPVHEFGIKSAYRQSVFRDWLILELRSSLTWPKDEPEQPRKPSWGVGVGFEMFFGTEEFLARPVTF